MPRYIDADAVLQAMWNNLYQLEDEMEKKHGLNPIERLNVQNGFESALKAVVTFPSSDVVEPKKGKWEEKTVFDEPVIEQWQSARCSVCGLYHTTPYMYYFSRYNYCPNCGADMREEKTDE